MVSIPDSIEMFSLGLGPGKPYLGTPSVVEKIIRHALERVIVIRREQIEGKNVEAHKAVDNLAKMLQEVFYGKTDGFIPSAWHRPSSLGVALVERAKIGGKVDDAAYRLALRMMKEFLTAYAKFEVDEMEDADFDAEVQRIVTFYTKIFSGATL